MTHPPSQPAKYSRLTNNRGTGTVLLLQKGQKYTVAAPLPISTGRDGGLKRLSAEKCCAFFETTLPEGRGMKESCKADSQILDKQGECAMGSREGGCYVRRRSGAGMTMS